jgi:hypothetical protein
VIDQDIEEMVREVERKPMVVQVGGELCLFNGAWFEVYIGGKPMLMTIIPAPSPWRCALIRGIESIRKWWQLR